MQMLSKLTRWRQLRRLGQLTQGASLTCLMLWSLLLTGSAAQAQVFPVRGEPDAPVTIVMFSAFHCRYCAEAKKGLDQLMAKHGGKVNLVFKHFPLSNDEAGYLPHYAALAAGEQGKFWEMHDALFAHQNGLDDAQKVRSLAQQLKLDMARYDVALSKHAGSERIKADLADANAFKVVATPTFYIDGYKFEGVQQEAVFDLMIAHKAGGVTESKLQQVIKASKNANASPLVERLLKQANTPQK